MAVFRIKNPIGISDFFVVYIHILRLKQFELDKISRRLLLFLFSKKFHGAELLVSNGQNSDLS